VLERLHDRGGATTDESSDVRHAIVLTLGVGSGCTGSERQRQTKERVTLQ
jgi:hypothetical protein